MVSVVPLCISRYYCRECKRFAIGSGGDPFQEKKLLEACLELIPTGALVGMQDMGAAGIICSTAETSAKGGVGMRIDLDKVPKRQQNMKAWELLLSESQERMLMVVTKGREKEVLDIFEKWDLPCSEIGEVTTDGMLRFYMNGALEAELPAESLVLGGGAPVNDRPFSTPAYFEKLLHLIRLKFLCLLTSKRLHSNWLSFRISPVKMDLYPIR